MSNPCSAACPVAKIVLTKMPISPRGESRPPTMLNPSDFFPMPLLKQTENWFVVIVCPKSDIDSPRPDASTLLMIAFASCCLDPCSQPLWDTSPNGFETKGFVDEVEELLEGLDVKGFVDETKGLVDELVDDDEEVVDEELE